MYQMCYMIVTLLKHVKFDFFSFTIQNPYRLLLAIITFVLIILMTKDFYIN